MQPARNRRGRELTSMFFKRGRALEFIKPGSAFRRTHPGDLVETAKVLSVGTDLFGIPHVRFEVDFLRPNKSGYRDGPRVLALKRFAALYTERVAS